MKRPDLLQGIIVAVLLSLAAPAVHHLVDLLVPRMLAQKLVIAVLTTAYVFYLLRLHHARIGNVVLGTGTVLILVAALLWGLATSTLVFVSITLIWIVRSLITYSSVFMSTVDGALCLLGLGVAVSAIGATGSAFWAIWCFFLSQSLFALIPDQPGRSNKPARSTPLMETGSFSAAHKAAEAALRELARSRLGRRVDWN